MTASSPRNRRPPQDGAEARPLRRAAVLVLLFNGLLVAWVLLKPGSDAMLALVVNSAQFVGPLLVLPLCFGGLLRRMRGRSASQTDFGPAAVTIGRRWAPVLLGLGILSWVFGQALFTFYEWVLGQPPPLPSIADVGYLSVYPFLLLGILLLPARPVPVASRTRLALDGLMIMTAAVTFSWYFILGPVMQQGTQTTLAKAVATAYPLADIVLIACLVILASRPEEQALRPTVRLRPGGGCPRHLCLARVRRERVRRERQPDDRGLCRRSAASRLGVVAASLHHCGGRAALQPSARYVSRDGADQR